MDKKVENKTISNDGTKTTLPSNINTNYKSSVPLDSHTYVVQPNDPVMAEVFETYSNVPEINSNVEMVDVKNTYNVKTNYHTGKMNLEMPKFDLGSYKLSSSRTYNMKSSKIEMQNLFQSNKPIIQFKNPEVFGQLQRYKFDTNTFQDRYGVISEHELGAKFEFNTKKTDIKPKQSTFDFSGAMYGAAGQQAGEVLYNLATSGETKTDLATVGANFYNAAATETVKGGILYTVAYIAGEEVIIPAKLAYAAMDASAIIRTEIEYLKEHNILTGPNIKIAKANALIMAGSGAIATELKFASAAGRAIGITGISATGSFLSKSLRDSYDYTPHKADTWEKIYVFRNKYIDYPVVCVLGLGKDAVDFIVDSSRSGFSSIYYWFKGTPEKKTVVVEDIVKPEDIDKLYREMAEFDRNHKLMLQDMKVVEAQLVLDDTSNNEEPTVPSIDDLDDTTPEDVKLEKNEVKTDPTEPESDSVSVDKDDTYPEPSAPDMDDFIFPPDMDDDQSSNNSSEDFIKREKPEDFLQKETFDSDYIVVRENKKVNKLLQFIQGKDINTINMVVNNLTNLNSVLEVGVVMKQWRNLSKNDRIRKVIGLAFKNFRSSTMAPKELGIIHAYGDLIMKDKITPRDFAMFVSRFPDTPLPITDMLNFVFAAIDGDNAAVQKAFLSLTLSILALSNPVFTVVKVLMGTLDLLDSLLTKVKVMHLKGIDCVFTDKIRLRGFFKKVHKCSLDNDFFDIHLKSTKEHSRDARADLVKRFEKEAHYKVYEVIGFPREMMDPDFKVPEGRLNGMKFGIYMTTLYSKWLEVNDKYFTPQERELLRRRVFESPDQKEFRLELQKMGLGDSWYNKHSDKNPIDFCKAVFAELKGCGFLEGLTKFFGLFVHHNQKTFLTEEQENEIMSQAQIRARDKRKKDKESNDILDGTLDDNDGDYHSSKGKYTKEEIFRQVNKDLVIKHISVGYIVNVASNSMFSNIGSSLAYLDKETVMLWNQPKNYLVHKTKQFCDSVTQSYISGMISEHLMTIPTVMMSEKVITDDMLQIIAPGVNVFTGVCVGTCAGIIRGDNGQKIFKDTMYNTVNSSLSTIVITKLNSTALISSLNEVSKNVATSILSATGVAFPPGALASIIISASLALVQRMCLTSYNIIYNYLHHIDYVYVNKLRQFDRVPDCDVFIDFKKNNPFFQGLLVH